MLRERTSQGDQEKASGMLTHPGMYEALKIKCIHSLRLPYESIRNQLTLKDKS